MDTTELNEDAEFDKFADDYRDCVDSIISISGEDADYFAAGRVSWLCKVLSEIDSISEIQSVMDFGCGIGLGIPHLLTLPGISSLIGIDVSKRSLKHACANYGSETVRFALSGDYEPAGEIDLAVSCSVFHHIPLESRANAIRTVYDSLRPGGWFALWEHNPWNPVVVHNMNHSVLDQDAIRIKPHSARRLVRECGFSVVRTDYVFFFPAFLRAFRRLEPFLSSFPLGAQYLVLARKPLHE